MSFHCMNLSQFSFPREYFLSKNLDVVQFFLSALSKKLCIFIGELGHYIGLIVHLQRLVFKRISTNSVNTLLALIWRE